MLKLLAVGFGGFLGAVARYGLHGLTRRLFGSTLPLGTFAVNVSGCLIIGALMFFVTDRQILTPNARLFLIIGFLGSFTTFSALGHDTFAFARDGAMHLALWNVAANVLLGVGAVAVGWSAAKALAA